MPPERTDEPQVYVDVVFEDGLLFLDLVNAGPTPARDVKVSFTKPIIAPDRETDLTSLAVFSNVRFLPGGKRIRVFVDTVRSYFARKQPNILRIAITWSVGRRNFVGAMIHDLRIYRDLPYVRTRATSPSRGVSLTGGS